MRKISLSEQSNTLRIESNVLNTTFHVAKMNCKLEHVKNWLNLFRNKHNKTIINNVAQIEEPCTIYQTFVVRHLQAHQLLLPDEVYPYVLTSLPLCQKEIHNTDT